MQRKWKNIHNNSLFPLKLKGNENQIAWDCCSDRWVGNRFFVVVGGKCRRSNCSTRQPSCVPMNRLPSLCSWGKSKLTVCEAAGRAGQKWDKCFLLLEEREREHERASWMLNVLFVLFYLRNVRFVAIPPFNGLELWPLIWDQAPFSCQHQNTMNTSVSLTQNRSNQTVFICL